LTPPVTPPAASLLLSASIVTAFFVTNAVARRSARIYRSMLAAIVVGQIVLANLVPDARANLLALGALGVAVASILACASVQARASSRTWFDRARDPLVLDAPFEGAWRVAAGGSYPGFNHHTIAKDQYFAYDFIRRDGPSLGTPILAPIAGVVAAVSDGMEDRRPSRSPDHPSVRGRELGNHVVIACERGSVFLCHLQESSVRVSPGQHVLVGEPVGSCGNSGRTTAPHLHVHAQDLAEYAFDRANGIPIAFRSGGEAKLLGFWSVLVGR
jgi:murein DD-endopeptidase MepM/ murein hydrolase activator NlpD